MSTDGRPSLFVAQVLFDYDAQAFEEITLKEGQFCHVLETNDAGWWLIREANATAGTGPKSGWAPSNFLRRLEADEIGLAAGIQAITPVSRASERKPSIHRVCNKCKEAVTGSFAVADGQSYHVPCFTCVVCNVGLAGSQYFMKEGRAYCQTDYFERFGQVCAACDKVIHGTVVAALDKHWHPEHFTCTACKSSIAGNEFFIGQDGKPYCVEDYRKLFGVRCTACHDFIAGSAFEVQGASYHATCFRCCVDQKVISESDQFHIQNGAIYCLAHFQQQFLNQCENCQQPIADQYVKILGKSYHMECFRCQDCNVILSSSQFQAVQNRFLCGSCAQISRTRKAREDEIKERLAPVNVEPTTVSRPRAFEEKPPSGAASDPNANVQGRSKTISTDDSIILKQNAEIQRDGSGQIRMRAADLAGKDRPLPEEIDRHHKENYLGSSSR